MSERSHEFFLRHALALAEARRGFCAPNPSVGAVVVSDGKIVGEGAHWAAGHPHAEVEALRALSGDLSQHTLYVTLEPCCHFGKTPPCTDLIQQKGIRKVIYGYPDPNPVVRNRGKALLEAAGVSCESIPIPEIDAFYQSYLKWTETKRPTVTTKIALSLDGKIAGPRGEPIRLTGEKAFAFTHAQRRAHDAILTTGQTILADNPQLNCRDRGETIAKQIFVLDSQLRIPPNAQIFKTAESVTVFHSEQVLSDRKLALSARNVRCIPVRSAGPALDLNSVLSEIGKSGVHDLWVEAGGELFRSCLAERLLTRAYFIVAPRWMGKECLSLFSEPVDWDQSISGATSTHWSSLGKDGLLKVEW